MTHLTVHPIAALELADAIRWYESQLSDLGDRFSEAIRMTVLLLLESPSLGQEIQSFIDCRRLLVPDFPYQVVYRIEISSIQIIAFAHLRRAPNYWKTRA